MKKTVQLAGLLGLAFVLSSAQASQVKAEDKPRQRASSVKFLPGSQESEATRAKRLKRAHQGCERAAAGVVKPCLYAPQAGAKLVPGSLLPPAFPP